MLYRNPHTTGNVCFDDISVQLYELPLVSEGSITATNESSYRQVSTVYNSKLTVEYHNNNIISLLYIIIYYIPNYLL